MIVFHLFLFRIKFFSRIFFLFHLNIFQTFSRLCLEILFFKSFKLNISPILKLTHKQKSFYGIINSLLAGPVSHKKLKLQRNRVWFDFHTFLFLVVIFPYFVLKIIQNCWNIKKIYCKRDLKLEFKGILFYLNSNQIRHELLPFLAAIDLANISTWKVALSKIQRRKLSGYSKMPIYFKIKRLIEISRRGICRFSLALCSKIDTFWSNNSWTSLNKGKAIPAV